MYFLICIILYHVVKTIVNDPLVITIFLGGMIAIPSHG